jgi:hypothetical protein
MLLVSSAARISTAISGCFANIDDVHVVQKCRDIPRTGCACRC